MSIVSDKKAIILKRVLGLSSSVLLVVGIMIGTGIFKKVAPMASSGLSQGSIIAAWIVAGIVTILGALSVSGLATLTTESGGEYEYIRIIFGNFIAFIFGWTCFTIIGSASVAAMSYLFTQSLNAIFNSSFLDVDLHIKIIACGVIMLLTWLNCLGTKKSTQLNNVLTFLKIAGLLFIIIGGFFIFKSDTPQLEQVVAHKDFSVSKYTSLFFGIMLSAFWAYDGWLSVAFISGEIKNPQKNVPIAIVTGISIVMVLYVLINMAYLKVLPLSKLAAIGNNEIAASEISKMMFGYYGNFLISFLILISALGSLNGIVITYSRMYYKMSLDGLFFAKASLIHSRYQTPYMALIYAMVISCLLVFSGTFDTLTDMIVFAGFLFYAMLAYGLIRMKKKGLLKVGRIGYPFVPIIFILFSLVLMVNTFIDQPKQTCFGILLMLSGIPFYYFFKKRNKKAD
jgi:APA family basic amino acid/polyamine antiporter